jgi:hypothetical protein
MRDLRELDRYRLTDAGVRLWGWAGDETCGAFSIPSGMDRAPMAVIASTGLGWDHVSVSRRNRCPNWYEMEYVKRLFFRPDEVVMQLHVPEAQHINRHPNTLHLWRPNDGREIPMPPPITV